MNPRFDTLPPPPFPIEPVAPRWPLERELICFGDVSFTVGNSTEGVFACGTTGAGKTSGTGYTFSAAMLEAGYGGLFLCGTKSLSATFCDWIRRSGRERHLILVEPGGNFCFNFLDFQSRHPDAGTRDEKQIVQFFERILENYLGGTGKEDETFWAASRRQYMSNQLRIFSASAKRFSIDEMTRFCRQAPRSAKEVADGRCMETSVFGARIKAALANSRGTADEPIVEAAVDYWQRTFAEMPEKTRACICLSFDAMADVFSDKVAREIFGGETNVTPEMCLEGALIVVNISPKEYPGLGILAQQIFKQAFQQAVENRKCPDDATRRPVMLFMDEYQIFAHSSDGQFQATGRSSKCCTLAMTQNIPNLLAKIGSSNAEAIVNGWIGNFNTLLLHNQGEQTTCNWMAGQLGKSRRFRVSGSDASQSLLSLLFSRNSDSSKGFSVDSGEDYNVSPSVFRGLATGGARHGYRVEAYLVMNSLAGRGTGRFYLPVVFEQPVDSARPLSQPKSRGPWLRRLLGWARQTSH